MKAARLDLWLAQALACSLGLCALGCRDMLGPEKMVTTTVLGKVTQGTRPVTQGWVEFVPVDGTVGRMRSARIQKDGSYQATKVAVGVNLIRLVATDIDNPDFKQGFGSFASPIRRKITVESGGRVEIDVVDEYFKAAAARARQENKPRDPRFSR